MTTYIHHLDANDILEERPFTHPAHIDTDRRILCYMIDHLCLILQYTEFYQHLQQPMTLSQPTFHRVVLAANAHARMHNRLMMVGFFGERRPNADQNLAFEFDAILIKELPAHTGILSYCTLQIDNGDYANLVLFDSESAKSEWGRSRAHAEAVEKLAPNYYFSVRIHNGVLPHGVTSGAQLKIERIKYFDYRDGVLWRAIRQLVDKEMTVGRNS